nr:hypothetical protein [Endozoicomonas sp.]
CHCVHGLYTIHLAGIANRRVRLRSLSLCTWTVHNPCGRDSQPSAVTSLWMDPVQSLYRMTATREHF